MSKCESVRPKKVHDMFKIPTPIVEILQVGEEYVATSFIINNYWSLIKKVLEWSFFYLIFNLGFGFGWILFLATGYYLLESQREESSVDTLIPRLIGDKKSEKEILAETLTSFPAWVSFPDFSRVDWINDILRKLWPNLSPFATGFVKEFIEPKINEILERMYLNQVSKFQLKNIILGSTPAFIGGIKVYSENTARDEIILDCDVSYSGDARVIFTLQGLSAEINQINFRGMARITLKPILNSFPFFGGLELFFLTMPTIEYRLGGVVASGDVPGIKSLVKSIVEGEIRSRFVWPKRLRLFLPIDRVQSIPSKIFMLPKPTGYLTLEITRGKNLVAKDGHFMGSGKSDPYVKVSLGQRNFSFRDRYISKTVNPEWNYAIPYILLEDYVGQSVLFEVYDHDKANGDDFLGRTSISMETIVEKGPYFERWLTLEDIKHGEIFVKFDWHKVKATSEVDQVLTSKYIASVYVDHCSNLGNGKNMSAKCKVSVGQGTPFTTTPYPKSSNPIFEEGFLFIIQNPLEDRITFHVQDHKNMDNLLGQASIPIDYLLNSPRLEFSDLAWPLDKAMDPSAKIHLSAKLFPLA